MKRILGRRTIPLRFLLLLVFVPLVAGTGLAVSSFMAQRLRTLALAATRAEMKAQWGTVRHRWQRIMDPERSLNHLAALDALVTAIPQIDGEVRRQLLVEASLLFEDAPHLASVNVLKTNGHWFRFHNTRLLGDLSLPERSALLVERLQPGQTTPTFHLFNEAFNPVEGWTPAKGRWNTKQDPRQRRSLSAARQSGMQSVLSNDDRHPVLGPLITLGQQTATGDVVEMSVPLSELRELLIQLRPTASSRLSLIDLKGGVWLTDEVSPTGAIGTHLTQSSDPLLRGIAPFLKKHLRASNRPLRRSGDQDQTALNELYDGVDVQEVVIDGSHWLLNVAEIPAIGVDDEASLLVLAIPAEEVFAASLASVRQAQWITLGMVLATLPLIWLLTRSVTGSLLALRRQARAIQSFDFSPVPPTTTPVTEVRDLSVVLATMRDTIHRLLEASEALGGEPDLDQLLQRLLQLMLESSDASSGVLYLRDDDDAVDGLLRSRLQLPTTTFPAELSDKAVDEPFDTDQALRLPLLSRSGQLLGLLGLRFAQPPQAEKVAFCRALAGSASIALETRSLISAQKALLASIIELMAGAIDAKSPYTGGHCARVPLLAKALADAACEATEGPYAGFALSAEEREALHVASWLHDVGKVTTPEYVVDKATKLETIHNRIHEVRMRFELLKACAEIDHWKAIAAGDDPLQSRARMEDLWRQLDDDFAFVAACNQGGERLDPEAIDRLNSLASRRWRRTLDDRLGLSQEELRQVAAEPAPPLPCDEPLLADRLRHQVAWPANKAIEADNPWGFTLLAPPLQANRGELHNLSISRGTLTDEERYTINLHILETIKMLEALPFPRHLKAVPEIAGGHHERMDGKGYPRSLRGDEMSALARMMAIADVFEALTAADRPYKSAKPLSVALTIMASMVQQHHLDPDLFRLFVRAGVYRRYADACLRPEQCDAVDEEALLQAIGDEAPST